MTKDDIIKLAEKAGLHFYESQFVWTSPIEECMYPEGVYQEALERFAFLAADAEREACIECIMLYVPRSGRDTAEYKRATKMIDCIRARGNDAP